jgi:TPR repeat protein
MQENMQKKKCWHFDPATERTTALLGNPDATYLLLDATPDDTQETISFYQRCPVPGYDVAKVQVIYNRNFNIKFNFYLDEQQHKKGNSAFVPKWSSMSNVALRQKTDDLLKSISHTDPDYPDVKLIPAWHGTRSDKLDSIFNIGYANLAFTDSGFFGKGLYSAYEAEYAYRVYYKGALIFNWVACFSALPVINNGEFKPEKPGKMPERYGDMCFLAGKGNYGNYDAHFVPVVPKDPKNPYEMNYFPWKDNQKNKYTEIVVFQAAACLPRFLVTLQSTMPKQLQVTQNMAPSHPLSPFEIGLACICRSEFKTALGHLLKAAELDGHPLAPLFLLDLYSRSGLVGPIDLLKSQLHEAQVARNFKAIENQASQNNPDAQYALGRCYEEGMGVKRNPEAAFKCYSNAANQNHVFARCHLGFFYEKGIGTSKDEKKAFDCYQSAADQGYAAAQSLLGFCYRNGVGVKKDGIKSRTCYESAANQGYAPAQCGLAEMYEYGEGGLLKDMKKALRYYKLAAEQGHLTAQFILGNLYAEGQGVIVERVKAVKWYRLAANQGHTMAKEALIVQLAEIEHDSIRQAMQIDQYRAVFSSPTDQTTPKAPPNPEENEKCMLQ